jgi:hypothetical protein
MRFGVARTDWRARKGAKESRCVGTMAPALDQGSSRLAPAQSCANKRGRSTGVSRSRFVSKKANAGWQESAR